MLKKFYRVLAESIIRADEKLTRFISREGKAILLGAAMIDLIEVPAQPPIQNTNVLVDYISALPDRFADTGVAPKQAISQSLEP